MREITGKEPAEIRNGIMDLEECIKNIPGSLGADPFQLFHYFADSVYAREIVLPADYYLVSKIHKHKHLMIFLSGDVTIISDEGRVRVNEPCIKVSPAGAKRALYTHAETRIITIHVTEETDLIKIESDCMAKSFDEVEGALKMTSDKQWLG